MKKDYIMLLSLLGMAICVGSYIKTLNLKKTLIAFVMVCCSVGFLIVSRRNIHWAYAALVILLGMMSCTDYIETKKPRKLLYPLFWLYWCIGMPLLEKSGKLSKVGIVYILVGCIATFIFGFWDANIALKEKKGV